MKIKEIIVVEGKDDTVAIRRAVDADTIETGGSAINEEILRRIKHAYDTRGVIVFTDPDYPGEKIRHTIQQAIPGCKHAFLPKDKARGKNGKGIGVEHATTTDIREALQGLHQEYEQNTEEIPVEILLNYGLVAGPTAKKRRERLGIELNIGYTNGKQLQKRLQMFHITPIQLQEAIAKIDQEEQ
ncbi:ribonuclease M5 [Sutcliffiella rhizosphaerae]|uniref:Ribonuclease M5 n=1 Tax=Sutcliffiella rhizosphaerae TaxID=2880967 RepID=A0ABM8YTF5_9BACI|nr:ribonuclease M5 [Sutcliffiella rhizosphaerae]CAG9623068.1 Ribonuclease M5 [Sutcliffiella rhizosphaerae]